MKLQRADARREIDQPGNVLTLQPGLQRVNPHAQRDIEHERTVFDQQVGVAGATVANRRSIGPLRNLMENRGFRRQPGGSGPAGLRPAGGCERFDLRVLRRGSNPGFLGRERRGSVLCRRA